MLNGISLSSLGIAQIVDTTTSPRHHRYDLGPEGDFWRNRDLIAAFGGRDVATTAELVDAYHEAARRPDYSIKFDAMRFGEILHFALEHGLVERIGARPTPRWRLLQKEMQFELIGPAKKQRALRIRNVPPADAPAMHKLWTREVKRRERARLRRSSASSLPSASYWTISCPGCRTTS